VSSTSRSDQIRGRLNAVFAPVELQVIDESHLHAGHAGARSGKGHFRVLITTAHFKGLSRIDRHRLVYEALGDLMESDIHALTLVAGAPEDVIAKGLED
jgi:BolA protein